MREASGSFSRGVLWFASACALGCSDAPPVESIDPAGNTQLRGAVQKGPFVVGSSITLSVLDARLNPTGLVFNTQTINDRGEFEIAFEASGPVSLQGDGFYYNEVLGVLSSAAIALRAFYVPNGAAQQQVYVNMVTHLTTERIKSLVASGTEFSLAVAQSEGELVRELSLTADSYVPSIPGTSMNLAGEDNPDNAYLLAVSATLLQLALDRSNGSVDATLQESLNVYSLDFTDGALEPQRKSEIQLALGQLNVAGISQNLADRLAALGSDGVVPNMAQVLDQDGDGVANIDDVCPHLADEQVDQDGDGRGDACDGCPLTACPSECLPAALVGAPQNDLCYEPGSANVACRDGACDAGLVCVAGESTACGGFESCCLPPAAEGESCSVRACAAGWVCIQNDGSDVTQACGSLERCCLPPGAEGEACSMARACGAGLDCSASVACGGSPCCQPAGELGQDCFGAYAAPHEPRTCNGALGCVEGADCASHGLPQCCLPAGGDGQSCIGVFGPGLGEPCHAELQCISTDECSARGLSQCCKPAGDEGEACIGSYRAGGSALICNGDLGCVFGSPCAAFGLPYCCLPAGDEGELCLGDEYTSEARQCHAGLACLPSTECSDPTLTSCCRAAGGAGQRCRSSSPPCDEELFCISGPGCAETDSCCRPIGLEGDPCTDDEHCSNELFCISGPGCAETDSCCRLPGSVGDPCANDDHCSVGLVCAELGCDTGIDLCCSPTP
jgi:hypothetical protein